MYCAGLRTGSRGETNGVENEAPVRYYVLGDPNNPAPGSCQWREADSWPPPSRSTSYFLNGDGRLTLETAKRGAPRTSYTFDPRRPVPTVGGANLILGGKGPLDQRQIKARSDYLRFATPPLTEPLEITGRVYVDLFVSTDAPDTDFTAKLIDIYPDGYEALILDGVARTRYRHGLARPKLMQQGDIAAVRVDLWSTSIILQTGHRLGVHISSSNDPRYETNPNNGESLRSGGEVRAAQNTIHHNEAYPSRILLPIVPGRKTSDEGAETSTTQASEESNNR